MMNDQLDLSMLDEQRKKALQALMQRMQANAQRSAGLSSLSRAGGGLGRQQIARFRPLTMRNVGILGRFGPRPGRGVSDRFGIVARMPGARDPGAVPGLGGVPADTGTQAVPGRSEMGVPTPAPIPGGGGGAGAPAPSISNPNTPVAGGGGGYGAVPGPAPVTQGMLDQYSPEARRAFDQGGFLAPTLPHGASRGDVVPITNSSPSGYVNVGGVPVPIALFKALNLGSAEGI
jgi:hypothetical protein